MIELVTRNIPACWMWSVFLSLGVPLDTWNIYLTIHLSVCLSIYLSVYLSFFLFIYISLSRSPSPLFLSLPQFLFLSLSDYLSIYLSLSIYLFIHFSNSLYYSLYHDTHKNNSLDLVLPKKMAISTLSSSPIEIIFGA